MSHLVEEVTDPDHPCSLARKIHCQRGSAAAEDTGYRVQFLAAISQIVAGYHEIGRTESGIGRKQNAIIALPKPVLGVRVGRRHRLE